MIGIGVAVGFIRRLIRYLWVYFFTEDDRALSTEDDLLIEFPFKEEPMEPMGGGDLKSFGTMMYAGDEDVTEEKSFYEGDPTITVYAKRAWDWLVVMYLSILSWIRRKYKKWRSR